MPAGSPIIGITADATADKYQVGRAYANMAARAGGAPIVLPCQVDCIEAYLRVCDAIVLTGGDDPDMSRWRVPMHPKAKPMDPDRQRFELALLDALQSRPQKPTLGICLGMQLMGLHAGGQLDQHLADHLPTADQHWDQRSHLIQCKFGRGEVHSRHRQALTSAGGLQVIATAEDGVIEAVEHAARRFYVGVQWHPERTEHDELGLGLFRRLVQAVG